MLKFILISILLAFASSQKVIPEIATLSYIINDDKGPLAYIHEHHYHGYKSIVLRDSHDQKPTVYLPYGADSVLEYEKETKKCSIAKKTFDSISYVDAINECIKKKTKFEANVLTCDAGTVEFTPKRVNGDFHPVKFTGLGLPDKHYGVFEKTEFVFTKSITDHLDPIPDGVSCQGLTQTAKFDEKRSYMVVKDNSEYISIKYDESGLNFELENTDQYSNRTKQVFLIDEAQIWTINGKTCEKSHINTLSKNNKYTREELAEFLWRENVFSKPELFVVYSYPDKVEGKLIQERTRLESKEGNMTVFGQKHTKAKLFVDIDSVDFLNAIVTVHEDNKVVVYNSGMITREESFYNNLFEEKMMCRNIYKSKRIMFLSEKLPKRDQYKFDNVAATTRTLADSISAPNLVMSPLRFSNMVYQIKDEVLSIEVSVSEAELPDSMYHKLEGKLTNSKEIFESKIVTISDCFKLCAIQKDCDGFTLKNTTCQGLTNIIFDKSAKSDDDTYIYLPYIKEIPIADAQQVFHSKFISIDKNQVSITSLIDSISGMNIKDEESFNAIYKIDDKLPCDNYINLNMPMTYQDCALKSKSYSNNIAISGFVYTVVTNHCKLCRADSPSKNLGDAGEYKFRFNFEKGYSQVFERKIKQQLIKADLYSVNATTSEECAEKCEMHNDFPCISYFLCGNDCFLTREYSIEKYKEESAEDTDKCIADRRADITLFTRSPVKIIEKNLNTLEKVDTNKALATTMDSLDNTGYIICPDYLKVAYIVSTSTLKNIFEWNENYNFTCDYHQKIASAKTAIQVDKTIYEVVEVGHSKGAVAGIVISVFLVALVASVGVTFFMRRRS